jgi:hypothetical protein
MDGLLDLYLRVLLWLALVGCFAVLVVPALPRLKGRIGEWLVHQRLQHALPASYYTLFRDLALRHATGAGVDTAQIDHVVVSPYGIFVIETRHYSGWIFGAEREPEWTRVHFRSRRKFPNPLRQNHAHSVPADLLGLDRRYSTVGGVQRQCRDQDTDTAKRDPLGSMLPTSRCAPLNCWVRRAARAAGVLTAKRLAPGAVHGRAHRQSAQRARRWRPPGAVGPGADGEPGSGGRHVDRAPVRGASAVSRRTLANTCQNSGQYEEQLRRAAFGHDGRPLTARVPGCTALYLLRTARLPGARGSRSVRALCRRSRRWRIPRPSARCSRQVLS